MKLVSQPFMRRSNGDKLLDYPPSKKMGAFAVVIVPMEVDA